jgi:TonB-dependent starch-binding outer membrane protein SusC
MSKKLTIDPRLKPTAFAKALIIMKLLFLLIIAGGMQASANVHAQNKVSLKLQEVQVSRVLNTIENQTNFHFLYNNQLKSLQDKVSIEVTNEDISAVLNTLFSGKDLTYKMLENNLIVILASSMVGQDTRISGKVTSDAGDPLSGVSVTIKGTTHGTTTNATGDYELTAPETAVLVISYVGYQSQEVSVNSQTTINVKMVQSEKPLDQIVVVGYGTQRKVDVTGSVAHVKGDELVKQPVLTATQALQGKVAGVQIISSGQPGTAPQVIIRGAGSILGGVDPLYVVDGIILPPGADITNINTADIASVDVLKDASSCAIYGARAANGVILITTKQGSGKMKVSYSVNIGMTQAAYVVPMANSTEYINYREQVNGLPVPATGYSTKWYNQVLRDAFYQNHNISLSGSSEKDKYLFNVSYQTNEGILIGNQYNRYTIRFNNEFTPTSFLKIGTTASFANGTAQNVPTGTITEDAYRAAPTVPGIINGKYGNTSQYQNVGNPILDAYNTNDLSHDNRGQGNAYIEIKPIKSLTLKTSIGADLDFGDDRAFTYEHPNDTTFFNVNGGSQGASRSVLSVTSGKSYNWIWDNTISFNQTFGKSRLTVLAGTTAEEYFTSNLIGTAYYVPPIPSEWYLNDGDAGSSPPPTSNENKETRQSYLGRVFYSYDDRYLLTATFRRDGSSVFAKNNQWGNFPGVSVGWVISKEDFMQNQNIFQYLKLRGGWGELGNSNIPSDAAFATTLSNIPYFLNGHDTTGAIVPQIKDQDIKWEITKETDIGLEFTILKGKLTGELDLYNKKVTNALIDFYVPGTFGSQANPSSTITPGYVIGNAASIDNKGIEFSARWTDKINSNFSYFIGGNVSYNKNEVLSLNGGVPFYDGDINGYYVTETKAGYPVGAFFMRKAIGVFQSQTQIDSYTDKNGNLLQPGAQPGDLIYKYIINPDGSHTLDTAFAGSYQPKVYFGVSGGVTYKSFDFSVDVYANVGNEVYNGKEQARVTVTDNIEAKVATSYWTPQNKSETQPAPNGGNLPASTYFLSSGNFFRINNFTIGYTVPPPILKKQNVITSIRLFVNAQNPVTIKKYSGFSSELPGSSATNAGIELNTYPTTRTFAFGLNVGF